MSDRFDFLELDNKPLRKLAGPAPHVDPAPEPVRTEGEWKVVEVIGGPGAGAGQFASPTGLGVDHAGNLYVADSYHHRVQRITPDGGVSLLGRRGRGPGEFLNPQAVVSDGGLGFYVLEQGGCRIQHFGPNGEWYGEFGSPGSGRGQMSAPVAMVRGVTGCLFVADKGNDRIVKWAFDGRFLDHFPSDPLAAAFQPHGIAVDGAGRIWVAEASRHRLIQLDPSFGVLGTHGGPGEELGQFREPQGLAVTPAGVVLVADTGNNRLQVLNEAGRPRQLLDGTERRSCKVGGFNGPAGVAVRGEQEAYLADTGNHRVLRLSRA